MKRMLAKSLAGHDKNHIYVVLEEEDGFVLLVNGKTKTTDNPKKKKCMHIQPIKYVSEEIAEILQQEKLTDEAVCEILDLYNRRK